MKSFICVEPTTVQSEKKRKMTSQVLVSLVFLVICLYLYNLSELTDLLVSTRIGQILLCIFIVFIVYSHIEPFSLVFMFKEVNVKSKEIDDLIIAHISDVHFQYPYPYVSIKKLKYIAGRINEINPDYVFMTGDFISRYYTESISKYNTENVAKYLGEIKAKRGVYAVMGNNDFCAGKMLPDAFSKYGIRLLRNESIIDGDISITGIDACKNMIIADERISKINIDRSLFNILLLHEPDPAVITSEKFDFQFSGHTHGGQVVFPYFGSVVGPSMGKEFSVGLFTVGEMLLHVSPGIGISPLPKPLVRFNNSPEVTILKLTSKNRKSQ